MSCCLAGTQHHHFYVEPCACVSTCSAFSLTGLLLLPYLWIFVTPPGITAFSASLAGFGIIDLV